MEKNEFRQDIDPIGIAYTIFCAIEDALMFSRAERSREAHLDRLADWFGAHVDAPAFTDLIQQGAPEGLPTIPPGGTACSVF